MHTLSLEQPQPQVDSPATISHTFCQVISGQWTDPFTTFLSLSHALSHSLTLSLSCAREENKPCFKLSFQCVCAFTCLSSFCVHFILFQSCQQRVLNSDETFILGDVATFYQNLNKQGDRWYKSFRRGPSMFKVTPRHSAWTTSSISDTEHKWQSAWCHSARAKSVLTMCYFTKCHNSKCYIVCNYANNRHAEWHYAECHYAANRYACWVSLC
jgi:hypothetical protein